MGRRDKNLEISKILSCYSCVCEINCPPTDTSTNCAGCAAYEGCFEETNKQMRLLYLMT